MGLFDFLVSLYKDSEPQDEIIVDHINEIQNDVNEEVEEVDDNINLVKVLENIEIDTIVDDNSENYE